MAKPTDLTYFQLFDRISASRDHLECVLDSDDALRGLLDKHPELRKHYNAAQAALGEMESEVVGMDIWGDGAPPNSPTPKMSNRHLVK